MKKICLGTLLCIAALHLHAQNTYDDKKAKATVAYVQQEARLIDQLSASDITRLPVGIVQPAGNQDIIIAVDSARITPQGAFFSAYAAIAFPGSGQEIAFAAKDVSFSPGGISLSSGTKLMLASAQMIQLSEKLWLELPADGHNYVEWDCNGFKAVNLKGNFVFSRNLLEPDNETLAADPTAQVKAAFEINVKDLNNILARVDISPFKISGLNDLSFEVKQAVVDMSDIINPEGFSFPKDYQNVYGESINLWRGFYLKELSVKLPEQLSGSKGRATLKANNLLLDEAGISGLFSANNILNDGTVDGWPLTINKLSLQLLQNKVAGGGMSGTLNIPFLGEDTLSYTADVFQDNIGLNYAFAIGIDQEKNYNMPFGGTLKLNKGCTVKVQKVDKKLTASAMLNGSLNINQPFAIIKDIQFEQLELVTKKPYITKGTFSFTGSGQSSMASFPISLQDIQLGIYDGQLALGMQVTANFMNQSDKGFAGSTRLLFTAKTEEEIQTVGTMQYKKQRWKFDRLKIEDIAVDCNIGSFGLKGLLRIFDNDAVYGKGFSGNIELTLPVLSQPLKANAYFGSKTDYRYWQVNVFAPTGKIPVAPPLFIDGIVGGMSYHMVRQQAEFKPDFAALNPDAIVPKNNLNDTTVAPRDSKGEFIFIPDQNAGLGFMAGVSIIVAQEKMMNGDALLEIAFREGGGIKYTQFTGGAYFFTAIKDRGRKLVKEGEFLNAPAYAHLKMLYDNDNKIFHANLKAYLNAYNAIKGTGPNGLVGEAVIHIDPKDWYVYIGRPNQMLGVEVLRLAKAQGYFMIGTQIEPMPEPPSEVSSIIGNMDKGLMRDMNAMATGKGFGVGARLNTAFSAPKKDGNCFQKKFPFPFYASFSAGGGADIMLRNYGDAHCKGSNEEIGINGWYASGQAYVYLSGKVGIALKKCKRHFDIVNLGAAAILQAKLPNPSAFKGTIAAQYKILGGLVKGKLNLKFTIGDECEIMQPGSELGDIKVIADMQPSDGGSSVSVFAAPQATFNIPIDQEFDMMNTEDQSQTYRVKLDEFGLYKGSEKINTSIEWNTTKDVAILNTRDILPPSSTLKVKLKIHFEKLVNNKWIIVLEEGKPDEEIRSLLFNTGSAPDFIPEENIAFSYPVNHQYNFYKNEYKKGYIKLKRGQPYLFSTQDSLGSYKFTSMFEQINGDVINQPVLYNSSENTVQFNIPENLNNNAIYKFSIARTPLQNQSINRNVTQLQQQIDIGNNAEIELNTKQLNSAIAMNVQRDLYNSDFRVSNYNTFTEKINAVKNAEDLFDIANGNVGVIGKRLTTDETFDQYELTGKPGTLLPLITAEASKENKWLKNINYPLLYELYPSDKDVSISWRDIKEMGTIPVKAIKLRNDQDKEDYQLNQSQVENGFAPSVAGRTIVGYYLSYYVSKDFSELRNKAAAKFLNSTYGSMHEGIKRLLLAEGYTDLLEDVYKIKLNYTLPGMQKENSSKELNIQF